MSTFARLMLIASLFLALPIDQCSAQVPMSATGSYAQNFDTPTLANTGTPAWTDNSTISSWYWQAAAGAPTTYLTGTGSGSGGARYSFGSATLPNDRAMGSLSSGTPGALAEGLLLQNTSGQFITDIQITYTGEQWRNGGNATPQTLSFYYQTSASLITALTPGNNAAWTAVPALNFTSLQNTATITVLDGNAAANRTTFTNVAIPALALANNSYIMLKWDDLNDAGSDHALSIDDLTISWTVSAPSLNPSVISFGATTPTSVVVNLAGGTGSGRILVVKQGSAVAFSPVDGTNYAGANSDFTLASDLGGSNFLVYNASGTSVTVTGLTAGTTYHFKTYDYDGVFTYSVGSNINNITTPLPPGPILYSGGTYTQTFDGLPASGTVNTTGLGNGPFFLSESPVNATGMLGWQYAKTAGSGADARFTVDAGTSSSGSVYSYGTAASSDRALGSLSAGAVSSTFGALIQNTSAQVYTSITVTFTGEQWRAGGGLINSLAFEYAVGGSSITSGTFTAEPNLNFAAPTHTPINSALDGNNVANQAAVSFTVPLNQNWDPGQNLVIRWNDIDDTGNDDGMAIDGMSFSAAGVTAPTTQDFNVAASNTLTVSSDINWTNGDGSNHLVILNTANSFTDPTNGSVATANTVYGGSGQQVVYNGTGSTVNVSGLSPSTTYFARVYGFNGTGSAATYNVATATNNPGTFTTAAPVPPTKLVITSLNGGSPILEDTPFFITVQTQDAANSPQNVTAPTTITLTLNTGFGTLSGTLSGVINSGNTVTISGILYDTPENPVILDANVTVGPPLTGTSTAPFEVFGIATELSFSSVPSNGVINQAVGSIQVQALRADFTVDVNYTGAITISVSTGSGNMLGTLTQNAFAGVATFSGISFDAADTYTLAANATGLTPATSTAIVITLVPTMTELVVPKFMGSKSAATTNANRTPFAVCVRFDNLVPGSSYDLRGGMGLISDAATTFGAGSIWNGTTYGTTNLVNYFIADGTGSSGPVWVFIQPTGNSTRFDAGQVHNLRFSIGINGQGVPTTPSFVGAKTITALDIATTARTTATADDGAYVRGTAATCTGGKLVLIYDNAAGTGDPLSVFQVRTTTPSDITTTNYSGHPTSIADIYLQSGTSNIGDYPGVVPIGANNANGVQRIELRNLDNTLFNSITDADGIWPGGANFTAITRRSVGQIGLPADPTLSTAPAVTPGTYGPACSNDPDITLGGTPTGGVWTGTGVTGNIFAISAGSQTLTYTFTDANGCFSDGTTSITVNTAPTITCPSDFTVCSSDAAFALTGGSPAGGSYSGTGVSGGNFDPSLATIGANVITYSYTDGNGCTNTPCTFTITVTQATTWYGDLVDGDGLGDPAVTLLDCTQPTGFVANNTDLCPLVTGTVGSACNDNNPFTTGDVLTASCSCVGTPVPCDNWTLTITTDGAGGETTWQMVDATSPFVLASGGPYLNNSSNTATICVPQGACFKLTVSDAGGNGITGGGWLLLDNTGKRIVDNVGNGACFASASTTGTEFCNEPASTQTLIASHCDRENWIAAGVIIASANAAVSAQWGVGVQTDDGYQFWFEAPCGGYSRRIFRDHATSGGNGPADALRATKLKLSAIVTNPLPANTLLNVRVRAKVNGVFSAWGPACRFKIDPAACTLTSLNDNASDPNFSCGVAGKVVGGSGQAGKLYAKVVYSGGNPATNYRFKFSEAGEGYLRTITTNNAALLLGLWSSNPLLCGTYTYDVQVAASFDGGATYCPYGVVCSVGITNNAPNPCTTSGSFTGGGDRTALEAGMEFSMYPNPNNGDQLFITLNDMDVNVSTVSMDLFDVFGKKVMSRTFAAQDGTMNTMIDLDDSMAAGLYLVNITAGDVTRTERLMIQR